MEHHHGKRENDVHEERFPECRGELRAGARRRPCARSPSAPYEKSGNTAVKTIPRNAQTSARCQSRTPLRCHRPAHDLSAEELPHRAEEPDLEHPHEVRTAPRQGGEAIARFRNHDHDDPAMIRNHAREMSRSDFTNASFPIFTPPGRAVFQPSRSRRAFSKYVQQKWR